MSDEILYQEVYRLTKLVDTLALEVNRLNKTVEELRYLSMGPKGGIKEKAMGNLIEQIRQRNGL